MKFLRSLKFSLPDNPFGSNLELIDQLNSQLKSFARKAGAENEKFKRAFASLYGAAKQNLNLVDEINSPIKVRALALALDSDISDKIQLNKSLFSKIDSLRPTPSSLLIQNIYQHYLTNYDKLDEPNTTAEWLLRALPKRGIEKPFHKFLLNLNGPKWLAEQAISNNRDFDNQLKHFGLDRYAAGRFITVAKSIYFVNQLKRIPKNEPHEILSELQKPSTFESRYDEHHLLGHKVLEILIDRAPLSGVHDSWLNVVMAIGGDPRVPSHHPKYQKWWSQIKSPLITKVRGWLSRLDLRLFLEALKDYSYLPGNDELRRMFPSRKRFLEGMFDRGFITHTRLYLARGAVKYLRSSYKAEHLPSFSKVSDGDKSIIYVQMGESHMIEGSHSCYLWIYERLTSSAIVFDYNKTNVSYSALTQGMGQQMQNSGTPPVANIQHNPTNFNWQRKAIETLRGIGISLAMKDVLTDEDYKQYKRRFGVSA